MVLITTCVLRGFVFKLMVFLQGHFLPSYNIFSTSIFLLFPHEISLPIFCMHYFFLGVLLILEGCSGEKEGPSISLFVTNRAGILIKYHHNLDEGSIPGTIKGLNLAAS